MPEISDIVPSAQQANDRLLVRRGAAPPHTLELLDAMPESPSLVSQPTNRIKGRVTAGAGPTENLTPAQVTAMLDAFTAALKGLVPASGGGIVNFLRADGTWAPFTNAISAAPATDQANWAPSGFNAGTGTIKLQPTTNCWLTGLAAGAADQIVTLVNDSTFVVCIEGEAATSSAANRFKKEARTFWLLPQEAMVFRYCSTLSRWCLVSDSKGLGLLNNQGLFITTGGGAGQSSYGIGGVTTTATTSNSNPSTAPTNDFTERGWLQGSNSTAAGTSSARGAGTNFLRGSVANRQGFFHAARVRFTALGNVTGALRSGMLASTAVSTTLNSALTNCLLIGAEVAQTTLQVIYNDSAGAAAQIDLGANFPVPNANAAYEYCFYAPPNSTFVRYMVRRLDTRFVAEGSLLADLPGQTTSLGPRVEAMVGATAVANTWQCAEMFTQGL
jgi:hypothetical protein